MSLKPFAKLPCEMQNDAVLHYYRLLDRKRGQLCLKRTGDLLLAATLLGLGAPLLLGLAAAVALDSPGGPIFCQRRRTRYNCPFTIYKFRTMLKQSEQQGELTGCADPRITRMGRLLRKSRLDELPQLWNVLLGEMSFVGPRPEVERFVERYDDAARATLLMPAGITSPASLLFANEAELLNTDQNDRIYVELLMPRKAAINLEYLQNFSLKLDLQVLLSTARRMILRSG